MLNAIAFKNVAIDPHESWSDFVNDRTDGCIREIETKIGTNFTPAAENVLRFLTVDLTSLKVVILGQDPYPQNGVATGRAFEVGNLHDWCELKENTSLLNILKMIYKNHLQSDRISTIEEIRKSIKSRDFKLAPPKELFTGWEMQGVLLLNTSLTCEIDKPNSHSNYWACFVQKIIDYVKGKAPNAKWLLWGNNAKSFGISIDSSRKFESDHPRLSSQKEGSFFHENHLALNLGINWYIEKKIEATPTIAKTGP